MSTFIRIIGRVLFALILLSSAYQKILYPEEFKADFARGYAKVLSTFNSFNLTFLPTELEVRTLFMVVL
jgi:hypothetical protein